MFRSIVIGNLGSDAEVKVTNGSTFISFSVGHNDRYTDANGNAHETTQWIRCAFNGDGGNLLPYLKKGRAVYVEGRTTARVFSSAKERRMVAGIDVSVDHLELLGSNPDNVPRMLADSNGVIHQTNKAFFIKTDEAKEICGKEKKATLYSTDGRTFEMEKAGWLKEIINPQATDNGTGQSNSNSEPEVY